MPRRGHSVAIKLHIGEQFVEYLRANDLIRTWDRSELATYYKEFSDERRGNGLETTSFSGALFVLARYGKRVLSVRRGQMIVFRGTSDFRTRSSFTVRKITSCYLQITAVSEHTEEWRSGHIRRRLTSISDEYAFIELEVKNTGSDIVHLISCILLSRSSSYRVDTQGSHELAPFESKRILVHAIEEGEVRTTELEITLRIASIQETLIRYLRFEVGENGEDDEDVEDPIQTKTGGKSRYVSFKGYIPGEKPDSLYKNDLKMVWPLPRPSVPKELVNAINRGVFSNSATTTSMSEDRMRDNLKASLTRENYKTKFKTLLYIEELQNQHDIKRYDMPDATLTEQRAQRGLLFLSVPGLAEKRPSVLRGDRVYVKPLNSGGVPETASYEGYVHLVEQERVGLKFAHQMRQQHVNNKRYYVRFDFNRLALRLMHRAVEAILEPSYASDILFPSIPPQRPPEIPKKMYNRLIENNLEQQKAVETVVSRETAKVFIIYGPPGTGKTITMVEAIHQILRSNKQSHMLVCAPSNSACDLLTSRLLKHADCWEILRVHAASRNWGEVPAEVRDVSNFEDKFCYPAKEELMKCRIIVTTLITAGRIASAKFPRDHFNYVFIDEAGQAMEPEIMISIAGVLADEGKIVLAGDPKQLGPVIRSSVANRNGLQMSYLERLMTTSEIYGKTSGEFNPACLVKLLKNYRSHEAIIHISNELFYDNELQVCADELQRNYLSNWSQLPKANFPVIFHGVQGEDKQESTSPSFFNPQEITQVKKYVDSILESKGRKVKPEEIGIISPYRRQVQKIRKALGNDDIKVGCVEEFQGQERRVIIVSTVRSNTKHLQFDERFNLGFLRNPKRFNVAITRAKALLIIIGNPYVLRLDKYWRSLLKYCLDNGGYTGISFASRNLEESMLDLEDELGNLNLSHDEDEAAHAESHNPQWRQDP